MWSSIVMSTSYGRNLPTDRFSPKHFGGRSSGASLSPSLPPRPPARPRPERREYVCLCLTSDQEQKAETKRQEKNTNREADLSLSLALLAGTSSPSRVSPMRNGKQAHAHERSKVASSHLLSTPLTSTHLPHVHPLGGTRTCRIQAPLLSSS